MPTLDDKAILKAMMEGQYKMGLCIKALPFTQEEKETAIIARLKSMLKVFILFMVL